VCIGAASGGGVRYGEVCTPNNVASAGKF